MDKLHSKFKNYLKKEKLDENDVNKFTNSEKKLFMKYLLTILNINNILKNKYVYDEKQIKEISEKFNNEYVIKEDITKINQILNRILKEYNKIIQSYAVQNQTTYSSDLSVALCQGVPVKLVNINFQNNIPIIIVKPFDLSREVKLKLKYFDNFNKVKEKNGYLNIKGYPEKINIEQFNFKPIITKSEFFKYFEGEELKDNFKQLIGKMFQDAYTGKGNTKCCNIKQFLEYKKKNQETTTLKRIGHVWFNRRSRHSFPIEETNRESYEKCKSFPAPIGIRKEDFCMPNTQNKILISLLSQLFSCKNSPKCPDNLKERLKLEIKKNSHNCLWCGEKVDVDLVHQEYCQKVGSVDFCHRDPDKGTILNNVYIGHTECNREQGGYSEEQRIKQIIRLMKTNSELLTKYKKDFSNL